MVLTAPSLLRVAPEQSSPNQTLPALRSRLRAAAICTVRPQARSSATTAAPSRAKGARTARAPAQLDDAVRAFLAGKGVNTQQLAADLRGFKKHQLTLPQVKAVYRLLGADYGLSSAQLARLVHFAPGLVLLDAESDLDYLTLSKLRRPARSIIAAYVTLATCLRMPRAQFGAALLGSPTALKVFLQEPALLIAKCNELEQGLGGKKEALGVVLRAPEVLHMSAAHLKSNLEYLGNELGWPPETVAEFAASHSKAFAHQLTSPRVQRLLRMCREVLGLGPTAVLQWHSRALRSKPATTIPRLAFVARQGIQGSLGVDTQHKRSHPGRVDVGFLSESEAAWEHRLEDWGFTKADWSKFEAQYLGGEACAALVQAGKEFGAGERTQGRAKKAKAGSGKAAKKAAGAEKEGCELQQLGGASGGRCACWEADLMEETGWS